MPQVSAHGSFDDGPCGERNAQAVFVQQADSKAFVAGFLPALWAPTGVVRRVCFVVGAIRLRLVATRGVPFALRGEDGKYLPEVLLDLDYWALMPL